MEKRYLELAENMVILVNQDEKDEFLNQLYMVLHLANGTCECKHENWIDEVKKLFPIYNS